MESYHIHSTRLYPGPQPPMDRPSVGLLLEAPDHDPAIVQGIADERLEQLGLLPDSGFTVNWSMPAPDTVQRFAALSLRLLRMAGEATDLAVIGDAPGHGRWWVQIAHEDAESAFWAGELATWILDSTTAEQPLDAAGPAQRLHDAVNEFLAYASPRGVDPNTTLLIAAAQRLGLPWMLGDRYPLAPAAPERASPCRVLQVGQGIRRRIFAGTLDMATPDRVIRLLADRRELRQALTAAGLSLPRDAASAGSHLNRVSRVLRAAKALAYPVVLRPVQRLLPETPAGPGRAMGPLHDAGQLQAAYGLLAETARVVSLEAFVSGGRYRVLLHAGTHLATLHCLPPQVIGDGRDDVQQLILARAGEAVLPAIRRAWLHLASGAAVPILDRQGLTLRSLPAPGAPVILGETVAPGHAGRFVAVDIEESGEWVRVARAAAAACGISGLCGVDIVSGGPGEATIVADVIAGPDLLRHSHPAKGAGCDAAEAVLEGCFPDPAAARIRVFAITGTNGKTTTSRMVAAILRPQGCVGLVTTDGARVGDTWLIEHDVASIVGASLVFADPRTEIAVIESARGGLIKQGLPFDHCDVAACLNVEHDHIGLDGVATIEGMAEVKGRILEHSVTAGIINADDPRCLAMRGRIPGRVILVSLDSDSAAVRDHLAGGGAAVVLDTPETTPAAICWAEGGRRTRLIDVNAIPATHRGGVRFNLVNAMHAAALCLAAGIEPKTVAAGLASFSSNLHGNPGRMNFFEGLPFSVLLDYAHNAHSLAALSEAVSRLPVRGRRILVFLVPDDRCDDEIVSAAQAVAGHFDHYICRSMLNPRSRLRHQAPEALRTQLLRAGVAAAKVQVILILEEAVDAALALSRPGDLLVIAGARKSQLRTRDRLEQFRDNLIADS